MNPAKSVLPQVIESPQQIQERILQWRQAGRRIGLVPTMGALHAGHLSLAAAARRTCDYVVTTIFVNPTQFAPHEDFSRYPRTLDADLDLLRTEQVDAVFVPAAEAMYPPGCSTRVQPPAVAERWEGTCRPGHFEGVATIVLKLFQLIPATHAYFGEKDYQQLQVIRQMVTDLHVPIQISGCPTVREADGLAMSSRNRYLSSEERRRALGLSQGLRRARDLFAAGEQEVATLLPAIEETCRVMGVDRLDYVAIVDPQTLEPLLQGTPTARILISGFVGSTRLIDNMPLG